MQYCTAPLNKNALFWFQNCSECNTLADGSLVNTYELPLLQYSASTMTWHFPMALFTKSIQSTKMRWTEKKRHLTSSYTLTWRSAFILIHVQLTFFCFKCEFVNLFTVIVCCNMAPWIKTQMGLVRWTRLQSLPPTSSSPTFRKFIIHKLTTKLLGVSPIIMKDKMFAFSL